MTGDYAALKRWALLVQTLMTPFLRSLPTVLTTLCITTGLVGLAITSAQAQGNTVVYGAYDPRQQETLWNEAARLQGEGRHADAITLLKRGAHLSRINDGLDAKSQLPYLRAEITSYRALKQLALADQRNAYLERIEETVLPSGQEKIDALLRQAEWHQYALLNELDEDDATGLRMTKAWNYYRAALNESIATFGASSEKLLPALDGMVRAQYLLAGHRGVGAPLPGTMDREPRGSRESKSTFKKGLKLLIAIQLLNRDALMASREIQARDFIRLGDWAWWTGNRSFALDYYANALTLANGERLASDALPNDEATPADGSRIEDAISDQGAVSQADTGPSPSNSAALPSPEITDDAQPFATSDTVPAEDGIASARAADVDQAPIREAELTEPTTEILPTFRILEEPVTLPYREGFGPVLRVKTEPATDTDLIVSFTVSPNGKINEIERVHVPETSGPRGPERVLRRMRKLRFRPVFNEGKAVESEAITWVFGPEHWASNRVQEASL